MRGTKVLAILLVSAGLWACSSGAPTHNEAEWAIDQRSYTLGGIGAFAEMVGAGVKTLALSAPLDPVEMDAIVHEAERIAVENGVEVFRETDFLVTDLFSESLTAGKHVLLICTAETHQNYMSLKAEKESLVESGRYSGSSRTEIARRFGEMLSYSEEKILDLLSTAPQSETN